MSDRSDRKARQAFLAGRAVEALHAARAFGGDAIESVTLRDMRSRTAAEIQQRASLVGKARRARGRDAAERRALALTERLLEHRRRRHGREVEREKALEHVRELLVARHRDDPRPRKRHVSDVTRFRLEGAGSLDPSALSENIRDALRFSSVTEMEERGVKVEAPISPDLKGQAVNVTFDVSPAELPLRASQLTSVLRSATGATRAVGVPPRAAVERFNRLVKARAVSETGQEAFPGPENDKLRRCCSCCCRCPDTKDAPPRIEDHEPGRPTWSSIPDDTEWHLKQMRVREAWDVQPPRGGASRGEGIVIAHPDTGWREHAEFDEAALRFDLARNVLENRNGKNATRHGVLTIPPALFQTHGTGTGGVIISAEASGETHVGDVPSDKMIATSSTVQLTGVAPKAELAPIRCADGVVLLMDTFLPRAIEHAIEINAHVISISLGGILDDDCRRIIDRAVLDHNIIVVAAAGQIVNWGSNSVIEPANFTNVIAAAGSTPAAAPWDGSCRGPNVTCSAPARGVWFPNFFLDGTPGIYWGEGTSFAAAQVAAVAALWLAHHGRRNLIDRYDGVPLAHVFRQLLRATAWKPRNWDNLYGAGIVDAYALLTEPLPSKRDVVAPIPTDEFNLFDAVSDLLDLGGGIANATWDALVGMGGEVGDFFTEMFNLNVLNEGLAVVGAIAEDAAGATKAWADEQMTNLRGMVDRSLESAGDAWDAVQEGGEEIVEAVGDVLEEGGELMEDIGDGAAETWDRTVDFFASLQ